MLDFNNPQSRWIWAASREEGAILEFSKLMTLLPTPQRQQILSRISRPIERLRQLNREHFGAKHFIECAISDLEEGCRLIAGFQSSESRLDGTGNCPVCSSPITNLLEYYHMTYCQTCLNTITDAQQRLESSEGFGTWGI